MAQVNDGQVQTLTRVNFFGRREMAELPKLLMPDEKILAAISGFYTAGTAVLCITSKRLLLVDKKLIRLSIEDVRFESIKEVNYSHQAMMASVRFYYAGREMEFKSWYRTELRILSQFVQQKMFETREKLHRAAPEEQVAAPAAPLQYRQDPQLEQYLQERIARWRRASRFVDTLSISAKAGRQVLDLELPKR